MKTPQRAVLALVVCGILAGRGAGQGGPARLPATAPGIGPATMPAVHHDVVDVTRMYQTLDHFGASDAWSMQKIGGWKEENRKKVTHLLFSKTEGIGLTCWRFNLGGGIVKDRRVIANPWRTAETFEVDEGKYDWSRQANERRVLGDAKAAGVPVLIAFVNSPPGRMTVNGLTNSWEAATGPASGPASGPATRPALTAGNATTNLKPGYEKQFARYLVDILEHFRTNADESQRVTFDWVSPVNEPTVDWNSGQEGSRYGNEDIKRVARALHAELTERKSPTKMLLVEGPTYSAMVKGTNKHGTVYGNYVDVLLGDKEIEPLMGGVIAHHAYVGGDPVANLFGDRKTFGTKMAGHPEVASWMSEFCVLQPGRDLKMGYALQVARVIWADFAVSGDSAWDWWLAISEGNYEDGLLYTNWKNPGDAEDVIVPKMFWAFGNYSRFIERGMKRVELTGENHTVAGVEGTAWVNQKSGRLVVVYVNAGAEGQRVELAVKGVAPGKWKAYVTSDMPGDDLREVVLEGARVELPGRSVVTLVGN